MQSLRENKASTCILNDRFFFFLFLILLTHFRLKIVVYLPLNSSCAVIEFVSFQFVEKRVLF